MGAFDQVMAEQSLFREPPSQHPAEGSDFIDSLAVIRALTEQILTDIGDRLGVRIDADGVGEQAGEGRGGGARQGGRHARLDDAVAGGKSTAGIETRLIEGMGESPDHAAGGAARKLGVAVEGDDETDIHQPVGLADNNQVGGVDRPRPVDQSVELLEFAALALPADVLLFGLAPSSIAVKQEEVGPWVALVEGFDALDRCLQQPGIIFSMQ